MDANNRKRAEMVKRGDVILIAALLLFCAAIMLLSLAPREKSPAYAVVTQNGEVLARLPLDTDTSFTVSSGEHVNIVEVSNGRARMLEADCPDGVCIKSGWISRTGEMIVCLPNRVAVSIEAKRSDGPDVIAS